MPPASRPRRLLSRLALFGPGMLVAATGVGAGDLLTASFAGSRHGVALLWAAWVGALLKWVLNEGLARWQMATGTTLVEGWITRLGSWVRWAFLAYLLPWAFFTAGALASACGAAGAGIFPGGDPRTSRIAWGIAHSLAGALLVWRGGFRTFERLMGVCVGLMVAGVLVTAPLTGPDWAAVVRGLVDPRVPSGGTAYTLGVLGGVGGTVTLLSYGYWIRETDRRGRSGAAACRVDLAGAYLLTALFGMAMIVIGSHVTLREGPPAAAELADRLAVALGPAGRWVFLLGFWGAVFSSLLGVWQSVPMLLADVVAGPGTKSAGLGALTPRPYSRTFLLLMTAAPIVLLWSPLEHVQLLYAVVGAFFMPFLALTLLLMNTRAGWVGRDLRNGWATNLALLATLALFAWIGWGEAVDRIRALVR